MYKHRNVMICLWVCILIYLAIYLQMALYVKDCQTFYLHKIQHTLGSCLCKIYTWKKTSKRWFYFQEKNYPKNWTRVITLLSGPPSFFRASTKCSWSSSVHLILFLLHAVDPDEDGDELNWTLTREPPLRRPSWSEEGDTWIDEHCGGMPYMS